MDAPPGEAGERMAVRPHVATVRYADGACRMLPVAAGQSILEAAGQEGLPIVSSCEQGICGTCVGRRLSGRLSSESSIGLSQAEKEAGRFLSCQSVPETDCEIAFDYPLGDNAASIVSGPARLDRLERLSPGTMLLTLDCTALGPSFSYRPGQFVQVQVPGTRDWRSYSCAGATAKDGRLEFLVRLLPSGAMSDYLRDRARPGDAVLLRGPKGSLYREDSRAPVVLIAGGTGLSATLAIAEQLCADGHPAPIVFCYGVSDPAEFVLIDRLATLAACNPLFSLRTIAATGGQAWEGPVGVVTDLLDAGDFQGDAAVYLCGPPAMVDAARAWLDARGLAGTRLFFEKFSSSGVSRRRPPPTLRGMDVDPAALARAGQGTAVVAGGSIAGIAAAKMLAEHFRRVVVLEKDPAHTMHEARPGAAQGWHLHHLLIAGQRMVETIFPGVIGDMVQAGAFKVDMGEQYRIYLAGAWKKVIHSDIDIVCAARPLLEWCLRRRLDSEERIEFRYESELADIVIDPETSAVAGVLTGTDAAPEVIAAEFVVDASGKNSLLPRLLERHGFPAPELDADDINCFYSTMFHRVPPERVWRDKVMVINYPYRPNEMHYAAQYYTDTSRTLLSTTLVGYDCYDPPRNASEFREFARRMPDPLIGDELDGLEPASQVYNFRYPAMQRYRYHCLDRMPGGVVALGDALASADPVSGAGMTKAFLEIDMLRTILRRGARAGDSTTAKAFYREAATLGDMIWDVIREQTMRFEWIRDRESKRAPFSALRNWYVDRLMEAMHHAPDLYRSYLRVSHFVEPPASLMRPGVVLKVLGRWAATKLRGRATAIEARYGRRAMRARE